MSRRDRPLHESHLLICLILILVGVFLRANKCLSALRTSQFYKNDVGGFLLLEHPGEHPDELCKEIHMKQFIAYATLASVSLFASECLHAADLNGSMVTV